MTDRLTEIRQRLEKATKGPWEYEYSGSGDYEIHSKAFERRGDRTLAKLWRSYTDSGEYFALDNADANFIANSKADVEFLLQEIDTLTERLEEAKEAVNKIANSECHKEVRRHKPCYDECMCSEDYAKEIHSQL